MRNHGLINRDTCQMFSGNSRLDTIQAIVANELMKKIKHITNQRIKNAKKYDEYLSKCKHIQIPTRHTHSKHVFHIYSIKVKKETCF